MKKRLQGPHIVRVHENNIMTVLVQKQVLPELERLLSFPSLDAANHFVRVNYIKMKSTR